MGVEAREVGGGLKELGDAVGIGLGVDRGSESGEGVGTGGSGGLGVRREGGEGESEDGGESSRGTADNCDSGGHGSRRR